MVDFEIERIEPLCKEFGININDEVKEKLNIYGNLLLEWNNKINLTAITKPNEVLYKHFYDCILIFKHVRFKQNSSLIDVGTGAGFPGMIIKLIRPDMKITLLDSLNKRLIFLNEVISCLNLTEINTVHMRAEDAGKNPSLRETYDYATARAVASLPVLLEYCAPLVKKDGLFIAMKGPSVEDEVDLSKNASRCLGISKPKIICEKLPENDQRTFIIYNKSSQTSIKYPRKATEISKQPL